MWRMPAATASRTKLTWSGAVVRRLVPRPTRGTSTPASRKVLIPRRLGLWAGYSCEAAQVVLVEVRERGRRLLAPPEHVLDECEHLRGRRIDEVTSLDERGAGVRKRGRHRVGHLALCRR